MASKVRSRCPLQNTTIAKQTFVAWRCDGRKFERGCLRPAGDRVMDHWTCEYVHEIDALVESNLFFFLIGLATLICACRVSLIGTRERCNRPSRGGCEDLNGFLQEA